MKVKTYDLSTRTIFVHSQTRVIIPLNVSRKAADSRSKMSLLVNFVVALWVLLGCRVRGAPGIILIINFCYSHRHGIRSTQYHKKVNQWTSCKIQIGLKYQLKQFCYVNTCNSINYVWFLVVIYIMRLFLVYKRYHLRKKLKNNICTWINSLFK